MKKSILLLIFCFVSSVFADGIIEIVPKPIDGIVGTDTIVIRGELADSEGDDIKIFVNNETTPYIPIKLNTAIRGFYARGIKLSEGLNNIEVHKNGNINHLRVTYSKNRLAKKSLWGRIANEKYKHHGEEQRAIYFYPGPRFGFAAENVAEQNFIQKGQQTDDETNQTLVSLYSTNPFFYKPNIIVNNKMRKNSTDTKAPDDSKDNCWSSKDRIDEMMDEIAKTNVNIIMFVYWGDHYAKLRDDPELNIDGNIDVNIDLPDNYLKVSPQATFPETCSYYLAYDDNFCIQYHNEDKFTSYPIGAVILPQTKRKIVECQCKNDNDCGALQHCYQGACFNRCAGFGCGKNQMCNIETLKCIPKTNLDRPIWYHYFTHKPNEDADEECIEIYSSEEYAKSGTIVPEGRKFDAIDQLFKAAADRNILVVPTLEPSVFGIQDFEENPTLLKNRLFNLLDKYGDNPNWLQVYDKEGKSRKVIHISQALGLPVGDYTKSNGKTWEIKDDTFKNALDEIAKEVSDEFNRQHNSNISIGFLLDVTSMPADRILRGWFFPSATDLLRKKAGNVDSLLGISTFGLPFDQYIEVENQQLRWSKIEESVNPQEALLPLEDHFFKKAKDWLAKWKNSGIPIIPDVISGFDDRWRGISPNPGDKGDVIIYGDNEEWHKRIADLMFMYNTAGFNLTIWNGYGEGYVWTPYRKRIFYNKDNLYSIHPDYIEKYPSIPNEYVNLNLAVDDDTKLPKDQIPLYEEDLIKDNYCFANYLFSGVDRDKDGVPDACDNCPDIYNPMIMHNKEIVAAPCETSKIGGAGCMPRTRTSTYKDGYGNWWWQPDHDLDGKGDACDHDTVWSNFSGIPEGNSQVEYVDQNSHDERGFIIKNDTLSVIVNMNSTSSAQKTETATTRYCWLNEEEFNRLLWGTDGFCTTEAKHNSTYCDADFGYSHGTDPKPTNNEGIPNWKFIKNKDDSKKSDEFAKIKTGENTTIDWDWRYDFRKDNDYFEADLTVAPQCKNVSSGVCQDETVPKFYYTMSTGVYSGNEKADYIINGNEINPEFFKNKQKYARTSRLSLDHNEISYHKEFFMHVFPPKYCHGAPCNFPEEFLHDMIINELINGPRPYEMPGMDHYFKNDYGSDLINRGVSFREWSNNAAGMPSVSEKNRPMYLTTMSKNAAGTNVGLVAEINSTATQLRDMKASSGITFEIAEMDPNSNGDWRTKGVLQNVPAGFAPTASVYHNGNLYVVSNGEKETQVYEIKSTGQTVMPEDGYNICFHPVKIVNPIQIGTLPNNLSGITLHSVGNSLMALGKGGNGMKVYKFSKKGFENITGANSPQIRDIYNVEVKDGVLYLAGGAELSKDSVDLKTDFWSFSETDGWQLVRDDLNLFPLTLRIDFDEDKIVLTNRAVRHNATTDRAIFNADGSGEITLETIKVEGAPVQKYEESFCISETGSSIFPGITNFYGECVKVENYDFDEITFPDYKLSIAGYKNNLYLGGLTGIRRVEIGENGEITKKEMIYSGESNNLAVYGNTLYAANYSEIDIFEIADDGVIQRKSSIKTNDCKNIRIAGNKFFAAENKRIRIFDLSNPLSPEPLKTISLGNKAEDLEITENQLFVYENLNGLLTRKGKVSVFDISDIENPQKVSDFSQYCNDPEMQKSGNSVYLGCKNGSFKVEETGLQKVNGSKNYLREGYVFDGILYQVFSGTLHLSSLKTEEIQEDGWL